MNHEMVEEVLSCPTLPTLPRVAVRVIELTQDERLNLDELEKVIRNDQALAAKILRTVNSSFYGLRRPCTTIGQALVMLGTSAVKSLALGFSLVSAVGAEGNGGFDHAGYWRRGLYTAVAAKAIAQEAGKGFEDEAFLGGLLQDIGVMAMYQALGERYLGVLGRTGGDHRKLVRCELLELEAQHPEVGALLAKRWKLPDELVIPVKYHERPTAAPAEHAELARCVGLGNTAHDVLTDAEPAAAVARFHLLAGEWFGLDAARCDALLERIAAGSREISSLFRLNTGPAADAGAILRDAGARPAAGAGGVFADDGSSLRGLLVDDEGMDPLTGMMNREAFVPRAQGAISAAKAAGKPLAVLTIALDAFPRLVAGHGLSTGDAVLVETAVLVADHVEPLGGAVCRWDNSMFVAMVPDLEQAAALRTASAVRAGLEAGSRQWRLEREAAGLQVTASVGVAVTGEGGTAMGKVAQLVAAAVRASEAAAAAGGNCVRAFVEKRAA